MTYKVYKMYSPHLPLYGQRPQLLIGTEEEFIAYTAGSAYESMGALCLINVLDAELLDEVPYKVANRKGITEMHNIHGNKIKYVYTNIDARLMYVKCDNLYLRGYFLTIRNLATVSSKGYEALDHSLGTHNFDVLLHNKRRVISRDPLAINNEIETIMGYVDYIFNNQAEQQLDIKTPLKPNLKPLVQDLILL